MAKEEKIPDLLPWDIAPDTVLTPKRILEYQAELLEAKSSGRFQASIQHSENEQYSFLSFIINVPVLRYRLRLFLCRSQKDLPYPTTIVFEGFASEERADVEAEFRRLVKSVFASGYTRSVFQSLIARIGEVTEKIIETAEVSVEKIDAHDLPTNE